MNLQSNDNAYSSRLLVIVLYILHVIYLELDAVISVQTCRLFNNLFIELPVNTATDKRNILR